jgi:uncharacterized Zn finger protein (UPF0148 family)
MTVKQTLGLEWELGKQTLMLAGSSMTRDHCKESGRVLIVSMMKGSSLNH